MYTVPVGKAPQGPTLPLGRDSRNGKLIFGTDDSNIAILIERHSCLVMHAGASKTQIPWVPS